MLTAANDYTSKPITPSLAALTTPTAGNHELLLPAAIDSCSRQPRTTESYSRQPLTPTAQLFLSLSLSLSLWCMGPPKGPRHPLLASGRNEAVGGTLPPAPRRMNFSASTGPPGRRNGPQDSGNNSGHLLQSSAPHICL
jgi:hypothetical protein